MRIKFAERKISANRSEIIAMSADRYDVAESMTPAMFDAEREIGHYFTAQTPGLGYASMDLNRTDRAADNESEDPNMADRMRDLARWKKACNPMTHGIVLDILAFSFDVDQVAYQRCIPRRSVVNLYLDGLAAYCKIRGWE